jgi:hypothetical protein
LYAKGRWGEGLITYRKVGTHRDIGRVWVCVEKLWVPDQVAFGHVEEI